MRTGRGARRSSWRTIGTVSINPADDASAIGSIERVAAMPHAPAKMQARPSR